MQRITRLNNNFLAKQEKYPKTQKICKKSTKKSKNMRNFKEKSQKIGKIVSFYFRSTESNFFCSAIFYSNFFLLCFQKPLAEIFFRCPYDDQF